MGLFTDKKGMFLVAHDKPLTYSKDGSFKITKTKSLLESVTTDSFLPLQQGHLDQGKYVRQVVGQARDFELVTDEDGTNSLYAKTLRFFESASNILKKGDFGLSVEVRHLWDKMTLDENGSLLATPDNSLIETVAFVDQPRHTVKDLVLDSRDILVDEPLCEEVAPGLFVIKDYPKFSFPIYTTSRGFTDKAWQERYGKFDRNNLLTDSAVSNIITKISDGIMNKLGITKDGDEKMGDQNENTSVVTEQVVKTEPENSSTTAEGGEPNSENKTEAGTTEPENDINKSEDVGANKTSSDEIIKNLTEENAMLKETLEKNNESMEELKAKVEMLLSKNETPKTTETPVITTDSSDKKPSMSIEEFRNINF